ncbi:MAG: MFS transporter, partial [Armatimonadetes bacterium]|nr:MFS transporter [Armatimonadota bacterium]
MSDANATGRRRTEPSARAAIADSTPSHWHGRTVLGLGVVSFLTDLHSEAILALLPQFMAGVLGLTREAIGFIEGLAEATVAVIQFLAGHISDRLGVRKPIVVAGYTLSTIVKALLPAASRPWHVLSIRVADRA